jgi:hypothetical protein
MQISETEILSPSLQPSPTHPTCALDLPLHQPLESTQPFLSWFSALEESMERDQQAAFRYDYPSLTQKGINWTLLSDFPPHLNIH